MKQKVINFLQALPEDQYEQFNQAFELYRGSENKNLNTERVLNASGYSSRALENLLYDLQKLHGIKDVEIAAKMVVAKEEPKKEIDFRIIEKLSAEEFIAWFDELEKSNKLQSVIDLALAEDELEFSGLLDVLVKQREAKNLHDAAFLEFKHLLELSPAEVIQWAHLRNLEKGDLKKVVECLAIAGADDLANLLIPELFILEQSGASINNLEVIEADINPIENVNTEATLIESGLLEEENENLISENENLIDENQDLNNENEDLKKENEKLKSLPVVSELSIREEFPFLNDKACPDEMKILISDKITAWNLYKETHERIQNYDLAKSGNDELERLSKIAVDAFAENQLIYDELNAYKETGAVLGKHPIFRKLALMREVEVMDNDALIKYKGSSAKFFSTNKKLMIKAVEEKNDERIEDLKVKIEERNEKLDLVNKKLGVAK